MNAGKMLNNYFSSLISLLLTTLTQKKAFYVRNEITLFKFFSNILKMLIHLRFRKYLQILQVKHEH